MTRLRRSPAALLAVALTLALPLLGGGCGSGGGTPVTLDGGTTLDLSRPVDASVPVDLVAPPDFAAPPEDLTSPPMDLAMGKCTMVGDWLYLNMFVLTLTAKGELVAMGSILGHYTFAGRTLVITDDSSPECMMEGKYDVTFSNDCAQATLKSLGDPCTDREDALSGQAWVRQ